MPPLRDRTVQRVMQRNLERIPDRPAVSDDTCALTHAQLWHSACRCAGGLRRAGIGEGDVVLLMLDNSVDYFVVFAALSFLGATSVPTNTAYKGTILRHVLKDSGATTAIVEDHYLSAVCDAADDHLTSIVVRGMSSATLATGVAPDAEHVLINYSELACGVQIDPIDVLPSHVVAVMYTSGTTGWSKGALTSQAAAFAICFYPQVYGPHDESDVILVVCPMFHATGLFGGVYGVLQLGASAHIVRGFSASRFWDDVRAVGATSTILVGAMFEFIAQQPARADDRAHPLRTAFVLPRPASFAAIADRFGIMTATSFGGTEAGSVINNLSQDRERFGSMGQVRPGWQVRLVDANDIEVAPGQPGEAIIRCEEPWAMATGYVNNPQASAALWRNGWLHTGDLLRRDAEGWFYFVDRAKDCIRRRGENISSIEVEAEVVSHPDVDECAAIGVGDPRVDQEVKVFVRRREGSTLTEAGLIHYLVDRMPYYSVPRYVVFVEDYPRTSTGKIRKVELDRDRAAGWDRETAGITVKRSQPVTR